MKKGFLLIVSGPAGVGKGTICNEVFSRDSNIVFSISTTTRKPRVGEVDGENYHFIDKDKFKSMIKNDEFLEHAFVHTDYYGTPKKFVYDNINMGKIVLLEIDVQGALQVKNLHPDVVTIFILPPSIQELERRIVNRNTENEEQIKKRLSNAYKEIGLLKDYDYYIINDDLEKATKDLENIIRAESLKVVRANKIEQKYLEEEL